MMEVTDEMVIKAVHAYQDEEIRVFGEVRTPNNGARHGAMRAALEAALSHAAGQDGEQCRAASGSDRDYTTDERAQIVNEFYLTMLDLRGAVTEEQECRLLRAGLLLRALSRGVPEGKA